MTSKKNDVEPTPLRCSRDEDGFAQSFDLDHHQGEDIRDFFERYGFVVIRDVLSSEEVHASREEFFGQFDRDDNNSATQFLNRPENRLSKWGIIGMQSDLQSKTQLCNRQNQRVYRAFRTIYNNEHKLIVDQDRIGAMRPTLQPRDGGANMVVMPDLQTVDNWLHLDCNPATGDVVIASMDKTSLLDVPHNFNEEAPFLVQGFLALSDAREQDGGFLCVPGSHKVTKKWKRKQPSGQQLRPDLNDPLCQQAQSIPVRAGCLVIWNAFTLHANHPNRSERWRLVQYLRMYPMTTTRFKPLAPHTEDYPEEFIQSMITPLGRRLFGIDPWNKADRKKKKKRNLMVTTC